MFSILWYLVWFHHLYTSILSGLAMCVWLYGTFRSFHGDFLVPKRKVKQLEIKSTPVKVIISRLII